MSEAKIDESGFERVVMRNGSTITFSPGGEDKLVGSGLVYCPNCGTPWEDERAALHCPCLGA